MRLQDRSVAAVWILVVVGGAVLGVAARLTDETFPRWVGNVGAIWVLAGFLAGRWSHPKVAGAIAGAASLASATVAYYIWRIVIDGTISYGYLRRVGLFWLMAALAVGLLSGRFGSASRAASLWWSVPIGAFFGEAAAVLVLSQRIEQVLLEFGVGILLVFGIGTPIRKLLVPTVTVAATTFLSAVVYRSLLG